MTDSILLFAQSFLEATTILMIAFTININAKIGILKIVIFAVVYSTVVIMIDMAQLSYHIVFTVAVCILTYLPLRRPGREFIWNYIIDILMSIGILAIIQIIITGIAGVFDIDLIENKLATVFILAVIIMVFIFLSSKISVHIFFETYYLPYRTAIAFSIISLIFLIVIVGDLIVFNEEISSVGIGPHVFLLLVGFFVVNVVLGISFFKLKKASDMNNSVTQYGEHLQKTINEYRALDHDRKHCWQMILLLNNAEDESTRKQNIDNYIEELNEQHRKKGASVIKDDVLISAMLHQKQICARQKGINFIVNIANSLKAYQIPDTELMVVLINLIDNAFEEVEGMDHENRVVQLEFIDNLIIVSNKVSSRFIKNGMDRLFVQGYSSKGPERGFGLSNVLSIAERYNINVNRDLINDMFVFRLEFRDDGTAGAE